MGKVRVAVMITMNNIYENIIRKLDWKIKNTEERLELVASLLSEYELDFVEFMSSDRYKNSACLNKSDFLFETTPYGKLMDKINSYIFYDEEDILNGDKMRTRKKKEVPMATFGEGANADNVVAINKQTFDTDYAKEIKTKRKAFAKKVKQRFEEKDRKVRGKEKELNKQKNLLRQKKYKDFCEGVA